MGKKSNTFFPRSRTPEPKNGAVRSLQTPRTAKIRQPDSQKKQEINQNRSRHFCVENISPNRFPSGNFQTISKSPRKASTRKITYEIKFLGNFKKFSFKNQSFKKQLFCKNQSYLRSRVDTTL